MVEAILTALLVIVGVFLAIASAVAYVIMAWAVGTWNVAQIYRCVVRGEWWL